jgi:hypothetical protein
MIHADPGEETGAGTGWVNATLQVETWDDDFAGADRLGTAVCKRLRSLTGTEYMDMRFGVVKRVGDYSAQAPSMSAEVRIQDFDVHHRE